MTAQEAICMADELKPNAFTPQRKLQWLSTLDGQVNREVLLPLGLEETFVPYRSEEAQLLIPEPYGAEIYAAYLEAAMDRENGEIARYNQSIGQFNAAYLRYVSDCIRSHLAPNPGSFRV